MVKWIAVVGLLSLNLLDIVCCIWSAIDTPLLLFEKGAMSLLNILWILLFVLYVLPDQSVKQKPMIEDTDTLCLDMNCGMQRWLMNKVLVYKALLEGTIQAILFHAVTVTFVVVYSHNRMYDFEAFQRWMYASLVVIGVCAVLDSGVYFWFLFHESNNWKLCLFSLLSLLCFWLWRAVIFVWYLTFPIPLPLGELGNADGFVIVLAAGVFLLVSFVCRFFICLGLMIKNSYRKRHSTARAKGSKQEIQSTTGME